MEDFQNIKRFCQSHDFKYFDALTTSTKNLFKKQIEKNTGIKTAIETIVLNHILKIHPLSVRPVVGPVSMVVIKFEDKLFYLFGDIHWLDTERCLKKNTPEFSIKIIEHILKLDKIVDFFYEQIHRKKFVKKYPTSHLGEISLVAENCIYNNETSSKPCFFKNIRFHQENVRRNSIVIFKHRRYRTR